LAPSLPLPGVPPPPGGSVRRRPLIRRRDQGFCQGREHPPIPPGACAAPMRKHQGGCLGLSHITFVHFPFIFPGCASPRGLLRAVMCRNRGACSRGDFLHILYHIQHFGRFLKKVRYLGAYFYPRVLRIGGKCPAYLLAACGLASCISPPVLRMCYHTSLLHEQLCPSGFYINLPFNFIILDPPIVYNGLAVFEKSGESTSSLFFAGSVCPFLPP